MMDESLVGKYALYMGFIFKIVDEHNIQHVPYFTLAPIREGEDVVDESKFANVSVSLNNFTILSEDEAIKLAPWIIGHNLGIL